ncbi:hypothetical protein JCM8097_009084 [Rhodosporidiobolus ruineniae]
MPPALPNELILDIFSLSVSTYPSDALRPSSAALAPLVPPSTLELASSPAMSLFQSSPAQAKRTRDDEQEDVSPGKRVRTWTAADDHKPTEIQLPPPPPTPNFRTSEAQTAQRMYEMLQQPYVHEDVDMGMDSEDGIVSNPEHPWNSAPRMVHQASTHSLSASSFTSGDSSMPTTPMDLPFNEQAMQNPFLPSSAYTTQPSQPVAPCGYPSVSNPTSFTDLNGTTHVFSSSPPLSVYPPPSTPAGYDHSNPMEAAPFPMHAWSAVVPKPPPSQTTTGVMRMDTPHPGAAPAAEVVRELHQPVYGWDMPRQASTLNFAGTHLI